MRVRELIEKLSRFNPNARIYIYFDSCAHMCIDNGQDCGGLILGPKKIEEYANEGRQGNIIDKKLLYEKS